MCFQEVFQLATEEASIFRRVGQADCLSSLVVRQLLSGLKVCVTLCVRGSDYTVVFVHLSLLLHACIAAEDGAV